MEISVAEAVDTKPDDGPVTDDPATNGAGEVCGRSCTGVIAALVLEAVKPRKIEIWNNWP